MFLLERRQRWCYLLYKHILKELTSQNSIKTFLRDIFGKNNVILTGKCHVSINTKQKLTLSFTSIFEKKYKEAKITSQSSSLNSNFVGILIPLVVCSISVPVLWRTVPYVSEGNRETDLREINRNFFHRQHWLES